MYYTDVLIVGAGPSGLTLAASLVEKGVAATVVDRQTAGANTSRAAVINARTLGSSKTSTWPDGWSRRASRRRGSASATGPAR
jgi:2-polyprenyl-6-methoxyphenol hydroxylase-like FAD-dependent oxidoreductase